VTHTTVTPLDLVKCRRQVDPQLYKGNFQAWGTIMRAEGVRGIYTGGSPTFFGYCAQGAFKYGGFASLAPPHVRGTVVDGDNRYEYFKKAYSTLAGPENAERYKTGVYLAASASAEFLADIALCPFEAIKVRMQTTIPPTFTGTFQGISGVVGKEGVAGLYKGIGPLWGRQIPCEWETAPRRAGGADEADTMMKFASFETIVSMIYARLSKPKDQYGKGVQTAVSFTGGYLAGILCAIVSHPADVMVSKLNQKREAGESAGQTTSRIYKQIGFRGLWNGLPVRIVMIGTLTGMQWLMYDSFKIMVGLPTTGGEKK